MNPMHRVDFNERIPFDSGGDAAMPNMPSRQIVLHDPRYPGGCGLLLAWDCDHDALNGFGRFLFRTGRQFVIQSSDPRIPVADQIVIIDAHDARTLYQRLSAKVIPKDDAFAHLSRETLSLAD
jgi:hypothetical protein